MGGRRFVLERCARAGDRLGALGELERKVSSFFCRTFVGALDALDRGAIVGYMEMDNCVSRFWGSLGKIHWRRKPVALVEARRTPSRVLRDLCTGGCRYCRSHHMLNIRQSQLS